MRLFQSGTRRELLSATFAAIAVVLFSTGLVAVLSAGLPSAVAVEAQASSPPPVLLGAAQSFAVLGGSGLTNTGVSTVNGDVGSYPTDSQTGFQDCSVDPADCVVLTGTNHHDDGVAQNAKAALRTAYDDAAGRTATRVATELGDQMLRAGVYDSASGTFGVTGTLTLDGRGNPDSVFIFQTDSRLKTAVASRIALINGRPAMSSGRSAVRRRSGVRPSSRAPSSRTPASRSRTP